MVEGRLKNFYKVGVVIRPTMPRPQSSIQQMHSFSTRLLDLAIVSSRCACMHVITDPHGAKPAHQEHCLLEQAFVMDSKTPVQAVVAETSKTLGLGG